LLVEVATAIETDINDDSLLVLELSKQFTVGPLITRLIRARHVEIADAVICKFLGALPCANRSNARRRAAALWQRR